MRFYSTFFSINKCLPLKKVKVKNYGEERMASKGYSNILRAEE